MPDILHADGISLAADLRYFSSDSETTEKTTGNVSESESTRLTQRYHFDLTRRIYPNLKLGLGTSYMDEDATSRIRTSDLAGAESDRSETSISPYVNVRLTDPFYGLNMGYRSRDVRTDLNSGETRKIMIDQYHGSFNWNPVDLPPVNLNFRRTELRDDPLTADSTVDTLSLNTRYKYRGYRFQYGFSGNDTYNHMNDSDIRSRSHNGKVDYARGFNYKEDRFNVNASARIVQRNAKFSRPGSSVDISAAELGTPFYVLDDSLPTGNDPFEVVEVGAGSPLTDINIGRDGGINPVSAGLGFDNSTEVATIYIQLSEDTEVFPDLVSPSQIAEIASSFAWQFYSNDDPSGDPLELDWTERSISSVTYNIIEHRFEIRLVSAVNARRVKVTTTPLTLAPGEIRYTNIRAFTTLGVSGDSRETEALSQNYSFKLGWIPVEKTIFNYHVSYSEQESDPGDSENSSWINGINFRHVLTPIFSTYGRVNRTDRIRGSRQGEEHDTDHSYSLAVKGDYFEKLSQSLIFSGFNSKKSRGDTDSKSLTLRTNAGLYTGLSMNLDLRYSLNTLLNEVEQTVKSLTLATNIRPNAKLVANFNYSSSWVEQDDRVDGRTQSGRAQLLWSVTGTVSAFASYNFREQEGISDSSTSRREFNVNWSPFPDGDLRFRVSYSEAEESDSSTKGISPSLTWKVGPGISLDLGYNTGTRETISELRDFDSFRARLRIFY
ncbi:MAG: hypothetical protein R6W72_01595 [Desulfurivibrionaceae bacterium]